MSRIPLVAANWKMHEPPQGWDAEQSPYRSRNGVDVIVFPGFLHLSACIESYLQTGAQYGRPEEHGAFTGDVSMQQLSMHGCRFVLCGHSERRVHHGETNEDIAQQVFSAQRAGITPILCVGETKAERDMHSTKDIVAKQLSLIAELSSSLVIAYEPVWAIGTGLSASADEAQEMHVFIRSLLPAQIRESIRVIYGGSVKPESAPALIAQPDIDGFLVGAASLDLTIFGKIVDACVR